MPENVTAHRELLIQRFEHIYASTYFKLFHFIRQYIKEEDAVKDVLQESYIKLWEKLETIKDDDKILPLLRTMVMNSTIDSLRKRAREYERAKTFYEQRELIHQPEEELNAKEVMSEYTASVNALPSPRRQIYQLIQEEGLSYKEVAARLQISLHMIKYHFTKARQTLHTKFSEDKLLFAVVLLKLSTSLLNGQSE